MNRIMTIYDVFIIGGGPGGTEAAKQLADVGKKVGLADGNLLGGTCLNRGCIPLKTFLNVVKTYHSCRKSEVVEETNQLIVNERKLQIFKEKKVEQMRTALRMELQEKQVDLFDKNAQIVGRYEDDIVIKVDNELIRTHNLIIATGSESKGMDLSINTVYRIIDSDKFLQLSEFPNKFLIVGAGIIGIEVASFLRMLGKEVIILEKSGKIAGNLDEEIAEKLQRNLERQGIKILLNVNDIIWGEEVLSCCVEGHSIEYCPECVLMAIGRKPVIETLNLDVVGVKYTDKGIQIDKNCRTNVNNIFACGDVTGGQMLAHVAYKQAKVIVNNILGKKDEMNLSLVPTVIYSFPEVAVVGVSEQLCKQMGISYKKRTLSMLRNGRYFCENLKDNCVAKMLVSTEDESILGIHLMGSYVSELIICGEIIIGNKMTVSAAKKIIFPHPSVGEIYKQLLELF